MSLANVKLSKTELALVTDKEIILTKNNIISKVYEMFGALSDEFQQYSADKKELLPSELLSVSPKIYKGEQYIGLPYVMLDYPRVYSKQDVLAIRCLFWWGNFFSITLHLSGKFLALYKTNLQAWMEKNSGHDWHIGVNTDAWQHHFENDNYLPLKEAGDIILNNGFDKGFIKLAKKIPLHQWDDAIIFFTKQYNELLSVFEN